MTVGVGPSARFSMAGGSLHPQLGGVLVFIGGCNRTLAALDDMYYLHTCLTFMFLLVAVTNISSSDVKDME
ncbi:hypothetical protein Tco_1255764 [Tanacetum coccineum]